MADLRMQEELELHVSPVEMQGQTDEFILTPSPIGKQQESEELVLEAEGIIKFDEITFDGEAESEERIAEAMKAYDAAMDEAADVE